MNTRMLLSGAILILIGVHVQATDKPPDPLAPDALAKNLRGLILKSLPPVLYEDRKDWGKQKRVVRGIEWKGAGKPLPRAQKSPKNHGVWRQVRVTPVTPAVTLFVAIDDVKQVSSECRTFTTHLALELRVEAKQQNWRAGIRTYSGSFRARVRVLLTLQCEVTSRVEKTAGLLPDLVFRLRVLRSNVAYDRFVTEHIAGVGGEMAEWLGDKGHRLLHRIKPSLEKNMMEKANAAIVRSADTKEVRLSFGKMFAK